MQLTGPRSAGDPDRPRRCDDRPRDPEGFPERFRRHPAGVRRHGAPLPGLTAVLVTLLQLVGGVAVLLGLATRVVALLYTLTMVGAAVLVHLSNGFYAADGGWELVGLLAVVSLALVVGGPGRLSLDGLLTQRRRARVAPSAPAQAELASA
jgi:putative oxidoreductase